jgi:hypothetical protein
MFKSKCAWFTLRWETNSIAVVIDRRVLFKQLQKTISSQLKDKALTTCGRVQKTSEIQSWNWEKETIFHFMLNRLLRMVA